MSNITQDLETELKYRQKEIKWHLQNIFQKLQERYENGDKEIQKYKLEEITNIKIGKRVTKKELSKVGYPVISGGKQSMGFLERFNNKNKTTIIVEGTAGFVDFQEGYFWSSDHVGVFVNEDNFILNKFIYFYLLNKQKYIYKNFINKTAIPPKLLYKELLQEKIFLPSLEEQEKIVSLMDCLFEYSAELSAELYYRTIQFKYYLNSLFENIQKDQNNEKYKLEEIIQLRKGTPLHSRELKDSYQYPVIGGGKKIIGRYHSFNRDNNTITISINGTAGFVNFFEEKIWATGDCKTLNFQKELINIKFVYYWLISKQKYIYRNFVNKIGSRNALIHSKLLQEEISLPSLEEQEQIVKKLDLFMQLISPDLKNPIEKLKPLEEMKRDFIINLF
ncbi:restriction endonuclease subunit S [Mycoplasmopsis gallopavonis]|uniref:Restriction modification enzyme subunit S2B n=1 Tax=Mycoplasmopsis gallopavonis TaxID=76629 RepID=A0A449AZK2_9BACT|nr:restriction endonuclease subunit S [Mycoplasmopsis gallopavonis]VEU72940.1 restriction modification enzyme subunit S2B [Mycoplasmopsis gallopavonis]